MNFNAGVSNINKTDTDEDGEEVQRIVGLILMKPAVEERMSTVVEVPSGNKATIRLHDDGHMVGNHGNGTERGWSPWRPGMGGDSRARAQVSRLCCFEQTQVPTFPSHKCLCQESTQTKTCIFTSFRVFFYMAVHTHEGLTAQISYDMISDLLITLNSEA